MPKILKELAVNVNAAFCGEFTVIKSDEEIFEFKYLETKNVPLFPDPNMEEWFEDNVCRPMLTHLEEFQEKDSRWAVNAIVNISFNINHFTPHIRPSHIEQSRTIKLRI
ncbi:hypothetical protein Trydic_g14169 [Trypoxylus dichotomus]